MFEVVMSKWSKQSNICGYGDFTLQFLKGDKVGLVDPKDRKKVVASEQVEGVVGELFHFKKIQEDVLKVAVWWVTNGNVELFSPNEDDCPP